MAPQVGTSLLLLQSEALRPSAAIRALLDVQPHALSRLLVTCGSCSHTGGASLALELHAAVTEAGRCLVLRWAPPSVLA